MRVTDDCMATMRAMLTGDSSYERLYSDMDPTAKRTVYPALIDAAFFEAVDRRFKEGDKPAVIEFVGEVRSRSGELAERVDPRVSERLILAVLGDGSVDDLSDDVRFVTELMILGVLISDERLDRNGLNEFLDEARKTADRWLAGD